MNEFNVTVPFRNLTNEAFRPIKYLEKNLEIFDFNFIGYNKK